MQEQIKSKRRLADRDPATGRQRAFKPSVVSVEQRKLVEKLSGIGCTVDEILRCVPWGLPDDAPIDEKTLQRHFNAELARGRAVARMRLKGKAYKMAMEGDRTMLIFLLKTQCGWSETLKVETTGRDGAPLPAAVLYLPAKDETPDDEVVMRATNQGDVARGDLAAPRLGPVNTSSVHQRRGRS